MTYDCLDFGFAVVVSSSGSFEGDEDDAIVFLLGLESIFDPCL